MTTFDPPALLGKFPTASPSSFRYAAKAGVLVFSDNTRTAIVTKVRKNDENWQDHRHRTLVYGDTYVRATLGYVDGGEEAIVFHRQAVQGCGKALAVWGRVLQRTWSLFFRFLRF